VSAGRGGADPVAIAVRFERFPATLKGAFVMRGADGNPHTVELQEVAVARIPEGPGKDVPLDQVHVDVAPGRDLFVPFEVGISDLAPGWYRIACHARVDGAGRWTFGGRPFSVSWPRGENRRGAIPIGRKIRAGGREVFIDRVELAADHAVVVWRSDAEGADHEHDPSARAILIADGAPLEPLPVEASPGGARAQAGDARTVSYPVPRTARSANLVFRATSGEESAAVRVPLS
jgi:hypothetical protein